MSLTDINIFFLPEIPIFLVYWLVNSKIGFFKIICDSFAVIDFLKVILIQWQFSWYQKYWLLQSIP